MPPRRPSSTTLFLGWFFGAPLLVLVVSELTSWLVGGIVAIVSLVALLAIFVAWRDPTTNADAAMADMRGLGGFGHGPGGGLDGGGFDGGGGT